MGMLVDLDIFESNVKTLATIAKQSNKTLRCATKSLRCPRLIEHAMRTAEGTFKGLMCFSVQEAAALVQYAQNQPRTPHNTSPFNLKTAFDDFLIAYPTVQRE